MKTETQLGSKASQACLNSKGIQCKLEKPKKEVDEKYEIKFWKDWLEADLLKRLELVNKLPLFGMCLKMKNEDMWRDAFATLINGYFEDLESAVYTKTRLENKKSKK